MDLSIVIPAYNEVRKIPRDIRECADFLRAGGLAGEIIVADDGSTDGTADAAEATDAGAGVELRVLRLRHGGKGWAVRNGMMQTRGDYAMFIDSGSCIPLEDVRPGLEMLRRGECEIAHASRKLPDSVITIPQPLHRRLFSRMFRLLVMFYLGLPRHLTDTQCGCKMYRGDVARELYGMCRSDGFLFDLEVLMRARARNYRVKEFPVHWTCDRDSRLKPARQVAHTISDLIALKRMLRSEAKR